MFPFHQLDEIKNSHEPPVDRNVFLQFFCLKRYTAKWYKKISSWYSKNLPLYVFIFDFYVQFLCWFIVINCKLRKYRKWSYRKYMQKGWCKIKCTYQSSTIYEYGRKCLIMNAFFSSQFNYCSLTWMFHNRLHGHSSYVELLNLDNSVSKHHSNVQILATEMFTGQLLIF